MSAAVFVAGMTLDEFVATLRTVGVTRVELDEHGVIRALDVGHAPAADNDSDDVAEHDEPADENHHPKVVILRPTGGLVPREPDVSRD